MFRGFIISMAALSCMAAEQQLQEEQYRVLKTEQVPIYGEPCDQATTIKKTNTKNSGNQF